MTDEQLAGCKRLYEKYANKRFTVTEEVDGHCWGILKDSCLTLGKSESCLYCMMMRRRDKQNKPCGGPRPITLRGAT